LGGLVSSGGSLSDFDFLFFYLFYFLLLWILLVLLFVFFPFVLCNIYIYMIDNFLLTGFLLPSNIW
jgi:hypothetical protein